MACKNKEKRKEYCRRHNREYMRIKRPYWRAAALAALGNKCKWCGFSDSRALQIDHVNGHGRDETKIMNEITFYKKVVDQAASGQYQCLCANCNWIKRAINNEVPGK